MDENNPTQNRPRSPKHAPDPATAYERTKPDKPSRDPHDGNDPPPDPDDMNVGQNNGQRTDRQINSQDDPPETGASAQPLNQIELNKDAV